MQIDVSADQIVRGLRDSYDDEKVLDLLAELAEHFHRDPAVVEIAAAHSGSLFHRSVAPFLEKLAENLRQVEAEQAEDEE